MSLGKFLSGLWIFEVEIRQFTHPMIFVGRMRARLVNFRSGFDVHRNCIWCKVTAHNENNEIHIFVMFAIRWLRNCGVESPWTCNDPFDTIDISNICFIVFEATSPEFLDHPSRFLGCLAQPSIQPSTFHKIVIVLRCVTNRLRLKSRDRQKTKERIRRKNKQALISTEVHVCASFDHQGCQLMLMKIHWNDKRSAGIQRPLPLDVQ